MTVAVLAGTRKGLFVLESEESRADWRLRGPLLEGWSILHAIVDPRDGALHACANHPVYGATVQRSDDHGETWTRAEELGLPEDSELKLARTWHVEPGPPERPGELWLGGDPACLFRSDDGGRTWEAIRGVLEHPTRDRWMPGAGGLICHSIQVGVHEPERVYIGISAAGTFRSDDRGETWEPANSGVAADFNPDPNPEVGQCVHKVLAHPGRADRLWQQNHCGVYRSDDAGRTWERLDGNGLPSDFGFALGLDHRDPDVAYTVPMIGAENRVVSDGRLGVYRTADGGQSWNLSAGGLPEHAWVGVLREGMASDQLDPLGLYLGLQSGSVFASRDGGERWTEIAAYLAPVLSVETGAWS